MWNWTHLIFNKWISLVSKGKVQGDHADKENILVLILSFPIFVLKCIVVQTKGELKGLVQFIINFYKKVK